MIYYTRIGVGIYGKYVTFVSCPNHIDEDFIPDFALAVRGSDHGDGFGIEEALEIHNNRQPFQTQVTCDMYIRLLAPLL